MKIRFINILNVVQKIGAIFFLSLYQFYAHKWIEFTPYWYLPT